MHFDSTARIFAFQPSLILDLPELIQDYGAEAYLVPLRPEKGTVRTLCVGWDGSGWQGLQWPETVGLTQLTDGRLAYGPVNWSIDLLDALGVDDILSEVVEITPSQLEQLRYAPNE